MTIDGDAAYQVLLAHDARFDGRLFVGVTSTGVYCRPICRVRMPARRNCRFFASPAQAEAASFRPCLKCRPEIAPGPGLPWTVMDASRTLALQAASALDDFAARGDAPSVADVAARLGVSDRHLRRIFFAEHGVTPLQYLQTRRLLLAKQLLTDTQLPISQIALTSGFRSLRRFNAAFLGGYRMNPTRLRKTAPRGDGAAGSPPRKIRAARLAAGEAITVQLAYRAPLDVDALLAFIAARAIPASRSSPAARSDAPSRPVRSPSRPVGSKRASPATPRGCSSRSRRRSVRRAEPSSQRRGAGSTSTPRRRRSPRRSPTCPARPGFAWPAASTRSSSPCARSSASR
jgi:AraC family transcriptional regulator of adaptative response / DNA-3-methyladenine glycosylase II